MLTVDKSNDYKEGYRDALKMVLNMTIDSVKGYRSSWKRNNRGGTAHRASI